MERKTILIVEADADLRWNLGFVLELEGYDVLSAANGQDALEQLAMMEKPALIFVDAVDALRPLMNRRQFLEVLKSDAALADLPVIVYSPFGSAKIAGADASMEMPLELDRVLQMASQYCA